MTPETSLTETVRFAAVHAGQYTDIEASGAWLVTGAVLMAQQAAAMALRSAGDSIPEQVGATEIMLRAASKDRLPAPYTLPFGSAARHGFARLVEARNAFMHPRGVSWYASPETLVRGLPVAVRGVRHLILTQPVVPDLVSPVDQASIADDLESLDALIEFLS